MASIFDTLREGLGAVKEGAHSAGRGGPRTPPMPGAPPPAPPWWLDPQYADEHVPPDPAAITPPPPTPEDKSLRGKALLDYQLRLAPHTPGTKEYDEWLLSLQPFQTGLDAGGIFSQSDDPEYDSELRRRQRAASQRQQFRASDQRDSWLRQWQRIEGEDPQRPGLPVQVGTTEGVGKFAGQQFPQYEIRPQVTIIGPDGEPLPDQFVMARDGTIQPYLAEAASDFGTGIEVGLGALMSGQYVWLGDTVGEQQEGAFRRPTVEDTYMSGEDAIMLPYHWSPEQVSYAQEALGLDPTGFVDQDLVNRWAHIVQTAAGYTQAGRRVDPFTILDWTYDATQAAGRGRGGGGGGGGGGAGIDATVAKAWLNRAMTDEAGREATEEEVAAFHAAIAGVGPEVDVGQFAIDWVRTMAGGEAASYQVATDFYQAMMQVLGAQTQAREGPA